MDWHNPMENQSCHEGRAFYSVTRKTMTARAWQFLLLCNGQEGKSYKNSILFKSKLEFGALNGGDYEGKSGLGGGGLVHVRSVDGIYSMVKLPGLVFRVSSNFQSRLGQFNIQIIKDNRSGCATGFGKVESGLTILRSVYYSCSYSETKVKDCGLVYTVIYSEYYQESLMEVFYQISLLYVGKSLN